jgi:hypothetical protein
MSALQCSFNLRDIQDKWDRCGMSFVHVFPGHVFFSYGILEDIALNKYLVSHCILNNDHK